MKTDPQAALLRRPRPLPQASPRPALRPLARLVIAACGASAAASAAAQDSSGAETGVQAVTVTARKRAELQIDVPISIRALSDKELASSGITSVQDLGTASGFSFTSSQTTNAYGRAGGNLTFRGLQGSDKGMPNETSGGIFLDGIAISGGIATLGMSDVARVEVLKGPQNAFFGRSTFGGAVNFVTRNPAKTLRGVVNTTLNQSGSIDADGAIEGPLSESGVLSGRIAVAAHSKAAAYRASDGGALGAESTRSITGLLYATPTDKLWLRLRATLQSNDDSTPAVGYIAAAGNTSCSGKTYTGKGKDGSTVTYTPGTAYFCNGIPSLAEVGGKVIDANTTIPTDAYASQVNNSYHDAFISKTPRLDHTGMRSEVKHGAFQLGYALPRDMDLAVNVGYNQAFTTALYDLDRTATPNFLALVSTPTSDLTMDARISSDPAATLRWLAGVSRYSSVYQMSQVDRNQQLTSTPTVSLSSNYSNFHAEVPAVYGSVEYDIGPRWTATAEARYQEDEVKSYTRAGAELSNKTSNFLPRLTLRFKPDAATSMYVNAAKGVQPLTVNSGYTSTSAAGKAIIAAQIPGASDFTQQPELTAFELGLKQRLGSSFQYAVAVYDQKWLHRLTSTTISNPSGCTTTYTADCPFSAAGTTVFNGNDARLRGIELSLDAQITPQLSGGAYVDYKRARWISYTSTGQSSYSAYGSMALTGAAVRFDGNALGRVPDLTMAVNGTYRFALAGSWKGYLRADLTYIGKQWESDMNFTQLKASARTDLRLGFEKGDDVIELFVRNLANDRSWVGVTRVNNFGIYPLTTYANQGVTVTPQEARSVGVRMRYAF